MSGTLCSPGKPTTAVSRCCRLPSEETPQCISNILMDAITKANSVLHQKKKKRCPISWTLMTFCCWPYWHWGHSGKWQSSSRGWLQSLNRKHVAVHFPLRVCKMKQICKNVYCFCLRSHEKQCYHKGTFMINECIVKCTIYNKLCHCTTVSVTALYTFDNTSYAFLILWSCKFSSLFYMVLRLR